FATEVYPEQKKLAQQFAFAEKKGIPLGVFFGSEEKVKGELSLRDLKTRTTYEHLTFTELKEKVKQLLKEA
ncbi:MAG: His/Gly/Thr/Pro-type tRNA ligase C-terminal domain-containing protein, partial [Spirochaetales bacterium]